MNKTSQCFGCAHYRSKLNRFMDKCKVFSHGIPDAIQFNLINCRDFLKYGKNTKRVSVKS